MSFAGSLIIFSLFIDELEELDDNWLSSATKFEVRWATSAESNDPHALSYCPDGSSSAIHVEGKKADRG